MIEFEVRKKGTRAQAIAGFRALADDLSFNEMRQIVERDATLKMILLLPEPLVDQALAIGRALQACAAHRHSLPEDQEEDYRKP